MCSTSCVIGCILKMVLQKLQYLCSTKNGIDLFVTVETGLAEIIEFIFYSVSQPFEWR